MGGGEARARTRIATRATEGSVRFLLAVVVLGCVRPHPEPVAPRKLGPPGTMTIAYSHALGWPYRVERLRFAIDGMLVPASVPVAAVPAMHLVAFRAELSVRCSAFSSDRMQISVTARRSVVTGTDASAVGIELVEHRDVSLPIDHRLRVRFTGAGAKVGLNLRPPPPAHCAKLDQVHRALCETEDIVTTARRERDIIKLNCAYDKLQRMEKLLPAAETGDVVAAKNVASLWRETNECVGEDLAFVEEQTVTLDDRCGRELPDPSAALSSQGEAMPPILFTPPSQLPPIR
jgi:hypothetical protein